MKRRGKWQGMLTVARFNWPMYVASFSSVCVAVTVAVFASHPLVKFAAWLAAFGAGYFTLASLAVSHWVYDRSQLYRFDWLRRTMPGSSPRDAVICHTGFDEVSVPLREMFPEISWRALDHFDAELLTEPSIHVARKLFPPVDSERAPFDRWPVADGAADAVFAILAIHEYRTTAERAAWFAEARRVLRPGGRVVLVEHLRNAANFAAFGPGFAHFHSAAEWQRSWEIAGLKLHDSFPITPFLRVFTLVP